MRITSSHHRSLSSASQCRLPFWYLGFLLFLLLITMQPGVAYAQSDGYVLYWKKKLALGGGNNSYTRAHKLIRDIGDQNGDGYGDFVACTQDSIIQIYAGGNPMDTIPFLQWKFPHQIWRFHIFDINNDGYKDLYVHYENWSNSNVLRDAVKLYLGGPGILDTIPEQTLWVPEGAIIPGYFWFSHHVDFNGDGEKELLVYCQNAFGSDKYLGSYVMYKTYETEPYIDSLPTILFVPDTSANRRYNDLECGDINGDGMADAIYWSIIEGFGDSVIAYIVLGNPEFDFIPDQIIKPTEVGGDPDVLAALKILGDINQDGKADMYHENNNTAFPYWYTHCISLGKFPVELTGQIGINTGYNGSTSAFIIGDINKDGYPDYVIRGIDDNYSFLYLGGHMNNVLPVKKFWGASFQKSSLVSVGDVNGDGADDIGALRMDTDGGGNILGGELEIYLGDTTLVSVKDEKKPMADDTLLQIDAHPNPFNSQTTIRFKVSHDSRVTITVHNILGQEITKEVYEAKGNTEFSYQLEATRLHLASGMYIVTATATNRHGGLIGSTSVKVQLVK